MVMLGTPAAFACSVLAMARDTNRGIARTALIVSSLELAGFAALFVRMFLLFAT